MVTENTNKRETADLLKHKLYRDNVVKDTMISIIEINNLKVYLAS